MDKIEYGHELRALATIRKYLECNVDRREGRARLNNNLIERMSELIDLAYKHLPEGVDL